MKKYKVMITGTTGMVGRGVLNECLKDDSIEEVRLINRSSVGVDHPKIKEVLHADFMDLSEHREFMKDMDACFFCLGVSSFRMSEEDYSRLTYDLTLHYAKLFHEENPEACFCYVSGTGTDSSENGRVMWARVKGRTENALLEMFSTAYMFRPGYIQPLDGIRSKTKLYDNMYRIFKVIYLVLRFFPSAATNTRHLGKAMIRVLHQGYEKRILGNGEINQLARS